MDISVKGKTVVITGAAGLIGGAMAKAFASHGAYVAVCDIDQAKCDAKAEELRALGGEADGYAMDQTSQDSVNSAIERIMAKRGRIDILMNNAGVNIPQSCRRVVRDFMDDKFEWMIDVDLHGMLRCCKAVLPIMIEQKCGCIINTSSVNSRIPLRNQCAFPSAKNAVNAATKALAIEYGDKGIRVNAIAPGSTPLESAAWSQVMSSEQDRVIREHIPMKRQAKADEIAAAALYLASDELASYCTGQVLAVDGGWTCGVTYNY